MITLNALNNGIPKGVVLNVNIPSVRKSDIKGVKICRQAMAYWIEEFDKRKNPLGQEYYWLTGKFINEDLGEDTDEWALNNNFISIVPVKFDLTAHHAIKGLNQWILNEILHNCWRSVRRLIWFSFNQLR